MVELFTARTLQSVMFTGEQSGGLQYLEEPLEGRVGDGVDFENIFLLVIVTVFNQHHGVDEGVNGRQLGVWRRNKQRSMVKKKNCAR